MCFGSGTSRSPSVDLPFRSPFSLAGLFITSEEWPFGEVCQGLHGLSFHIGCSTQEKDEKWGVVGLFSGGNKEW